MDQETNPSPTPNPQPQSGSSSSLFIVVIILLVVLAVMVILGFWGYNIYQAKKTNSETARDSATATASTQTSATVSASPNDYVIYDSDSREVTKSELQPLSEWQLKVARNEIYARHGQEFEHQDLQCYFKKLSWYKVNSDFSQSDLSTIENKNIVTITEYEKEIDSSYSDYDSGCSNL